MKKIMVFAAALLSQAVASNRTEALDYYRNGKECIVHRTLCGVCNKPSQEVYNFQDGTTSATDFSSFHQNCELQSEMITLTDKSSTALNGLLREFAEHQYVLSNTFTTKGSENFKLDTSTFGPGQIVVSDLLSGCALTSLEGSTLDTSSGSLTISKDLGTLDLATFKIDPLIFPPIELITVQDLLKK